MDTILREKHRQFQRGELSLAQLFVALDRYGQLGAFLAEENNLQEYHIQCVKEGGLKSFRFFEKPAVELIKWFACQKLTKPGLIICRAAYRERWGKILSKNNIAHELVLSSTHHYQMREAIDSGKIVVLSYETFSLIHNIPKVWSLVVCDNIEKLKHPRTLRSDNLLHFLEETKPQWRILVGEINIVQLDQAYNICKILAPNKFPPSYFNFCRVYMQPQKPFGYKEVPGARKRVLELLTSS